MTMAAVQSAFMIVCMYTAEQHRKVKKEKQKDKVKVENKNQTDFGCRTTL